MFSEVFIDDQERKIRKRVVILVYNKKKELLNIESDIISFPGGGVYTHETLEQAAIREVKEETGWIIGDLKSILFPEDVNRVYTFDKMNQGSTKFEMFDEEQHFYFYASAELFDPDKSIYEGESRFEQFKFLSPDDILKSIANSYDKLLTFPRNLFKAKLDIFAIEFFKGLPSEEVIPKVARENFYINWAKRR